MKYKFDTYDIEIEGNKNLGFFEVLLNIANELAEENRLKRLSMELELLKKEIVTTPANLDKFIKDLEDQA